MGWSSKNHQTRNVWNPGAIVSKSWLHWTKPPNRTVYLPNLLTLPETSIVSPPKNGGFPIGISFSRGLFSGRVTGRPDRRKKIIAWFFSGCLGWRFVGHFFFWTKNDRRVIPTNARWQPVPHLLLILSHLGCEKKQPRTFFGEETEWGARKDDSPFFWSFPGHKFTGATYFSWLRICYMIYGGFLKWWGFPPNHPLENRVFHYFHHPFWGFSPYFLETPI